jgi:20S proteasome alpha/beta subunit
MTLKPQRPYLLRKRFRQKEPQMTIALGLKCLDGVVILTDSLETDGVTKKYVDKIWSYQVNQEWGIAIASAGEADLADSFNDTLYGILGNEGFDEIKLMGKLKSAIAQTRRTYPDSDLAMIVGIFGPPMIRKLYRVTADSKHLGPIQIYEALGIGSSLVKFLCSQMFDQFILVEEAIRFGVFALSRCNEHVDGCGGPISVIAHKKGSKGWIVEPAQGVLEIQAELPPSKFRRSLIDYWMANNASVLRVKHDRYKEYVGGGSARWNLVAGKIATIKPSVSRKLEPEQ